MGALKKTYNINQCALYKIGSKKRLASILNVSVEYLLKLAQNPSYRVFALPESVCQFTGKVTKERWVQEPSEKLRKVHERIQALLMRVTPPSYAHAAVKGRSYRTNAVAHVSGAWVATFDITKFYPSTPEGKVFEFFSKRLCCSPDVAGLITSLVCYKSGGENARAGLPTGSPLSPILSVYANIGLFDALESLAKKFGLTFTCYVDDVTFSGSALPPRLAKIVSLMMLRHGHRMSESKTRVFGPNQAKHITGIVVKSGNIYVPFSRFRKARRIQIAIQSESEFDKKIELSRKLAGLLGEAAFLDKRYAGWAKSSYQILATQPKVSTTPAVVAV